MYILNDGKIKYYIIYKTSSTKKNEPMTIKTIQHVEVYNI